MTDTQPCGCLNTKRALQYALHGEPAPSCPQHDNTATPGTPIALNNDAALAATIGAHLTKETH